MNRLKLDDNFLSAMLKMVDGNPGAMTAMMEIEGKDAKIDPDAAMSGFGPLLALDSMGIYGTDIYVLWSDICGKETNKMLAVLRAVQLGYLSSDILRDACSRQDYSGRELVDVESLYSQVCERLPNFDMENREVKSPEYQKEE